MPRPGSSSALLSIALVLSQVVVHMKVDDQRKMVRGLASEPRVDDPRVANLERTAYKCLVERNDRPVRRERAEPGSRRGHLHESVRSKRAASQRVEPVVEVAGDQASAGEPIRGRERGRASAAPASDARVRPAQDASSRDESSPFGRLDDGHLGTSRLPPFSPQGNLLRRTKRPARKHEIAVPAVLEPHIALVQVRSRLQAPR